jgi:glutamate--cysteine ligase
MIPKILTREICRNFIEDQIFDTNGSGNTGTLSGEIGFIGLELEAFPYRIYQKNIQTVSLNGGAGSLSNALIYASKDYEGVSSYLIDSDSKESDKSQISKIEFANGNNFQFEPGGQIEISTAPCLSMEKINAQLRSMQDILCQVTKQDNIHFGHFGTNPWFNVQEIGLQMNKPRFRALAQYFDAINSFGKQMMLQTCSLQVNLDLGPDATTRKNRIVAANLMAPFVTAIFANSSIIGGKVNGLKSYRSFIWQHLDSTRTGILPIDRISNILNKENLIDAYLKFALKAPVIYIEDFGDRVFPGNFTFEYWITNPINNLSPTIKHLKNHLSLLFPEVRLKGYLELRSVDAPPPEWQMIPAFFYCGLLYSKQQLEKTLDLLLPFATQLSKLMEKATWGMESDKIFNASKKLMHLAIEGFSGLPESFRSENDIHQLISFSERFTLQRKTFADRCLERFINDKILFY